MAKTTPAKSAKKSSATAKKTPAKKTIPPKKAVEKKPSSKTKSAAKSSPAKKVSKTLADTEVRSKKAARSSTSSDKPTTKAKKKSASSKSSAPVQKSNSTAVSSSAQPDQPVSSSSSSSASSSDKAGASTAKSKGRDALRSRILGKAKASKSISFSLDEVKAIAKTTRSKKEETTVKKTTKVVDKTAEIEAKLAAAKPSRVGAASLADILGFNPTAGAKPVYNDPKLVPEKFRRYYKLLIELRTHLTGQIDQHSEETLKRSSKDDAGDLSSYGQHMADAGTDTFDRDFALSLVANEQEALSEIEAAIKRIHKGTYGVCEINGKPIDKERLLAVPFTRYSAEAQKELERNRHRVRTQAGLLLDAGDDANSMRDPNADDE